MNIISALEFISQILDTSNNKAHRNFEISLNQFSTYTPAEYRTLLGEQTSIKK